jgi:NAD(P)-dependent dehydrogenase (short-subunit alcohol dehydrogenase family)
MTFTLDLSGRRAVVTGAGRHVGRALARALAEAGAEVGVNDLYGDRIDDTIELIHDDGGAAFRLPFDVTDADAVEAALADVGTDILVNNAGNAGAEELTGVPPRLLDSKPGDWDKFFRVNLFGVMYCTRAVLPAMVERQWGRVITIVSDAARKPQAGMTAYGAAKGGAAAFCRAAAAEVGRNGITVNCISLGTIPQEQWEMADGPSEVSEHRQRAVREYTLRRFGTPEDITGMVVLLASDRGSWITGQTIPVNGGFTFSL